MAVLTNTYTVPHGIRPSPTLSADKQGDAARAAGVNVVKMTVGDIARHPFPNEVDGWQHSLMKKASGVELNEPINHLTRDIYAYGPAAGVPGLRAVAAMRYEEDTGIKGIQSSNIAVGAGSKGALAGVASMFSPGDEVIVFSPGWPTNYDFFPEGVKIVEVDTGGRGLLGAKELEEVLTKQHPNAKAILINSPNNPTGAKYSAEEREQVMGVIKEHGPKDMLVMLDNPYGRLVFDGTDQIRGPNETELFNAGKIAEFRTISKEYGLAGARVGYVVSMNPMVVAQLTSWNASISGGVPVASQNLAQAALLFGDDYVEKNVADLCSKRDVLQAGVDELKFATMETPPGAIYGWVDFSGLQGKVVLEGKTLDKKPLVIQTPADAMRYLVEVAGVNGVPGIPFHAPGSPFAKDDWHVRFCFSGRVEDIKKACDQMKEAEQCLTNPMDRVKQAPAAQRDR